MPPCLLRRCWKKRLKLRLRKPNEMPVSSYLTIFCLGSAMKRMTLREAFASGGCFYRRDAVRARVDRRVPTGDSGVRPRHSRLARCLRHGAGRCPRLRRRHPRARRRCRWRRWPTWFRRASIPIMTLVWAGATALSGAVGAFQPAWDQRSCWLWPLLPNPGVEFAAHGHLSDPGPVLLKFEGLSFHHFGQRIGPLLVGGIAAAVGGDDGRGGALVIIAILPVLAAPAPDR